MNTQIKTAGKLVVGDQVAEADGSSSTSLRSSRRRRRR